MDEMSRLRSEVDDALGPLLVREFAAPHQAGRRGLGSLAGNAKTFRDLACR
jgi:hypothetical protein